MVNPLDRYQRQMQLPEVGKIGQSKLQKAKILLVGAGGLGCPALLYLASAGVSHITIVDADEVSLNNLHRQVLYTEAQCGQKKVDAAIANLQQHNSQITFNPISTTINPDNVGSLVMQAGIVLDCADNFATSYILSDCCYLAKKPLISASAVGISGYLGGFCGPSSPSLRAVFPSVPRQAGNCASLGVLGTMVGIIGSMQAHLCLTTLLSFEPSPLGQLIRINGHNMQQSHFRFDQAEEPKQPVAQFINATSILGNDYVIDLRGVDEITTPVCDHVSYLNLEKISAQTVKPAPQQRLIFVCQSGLRALKAAEKTQTFWSGNIKLVADSILPRIQP